MKLFIFLSLLLFPSLCLAAPVILPVPFTSEIPDGTWNKPWNNACEEASIVMVDQYYKGAKQMNKETAKALMWPFFAIEDRLFGSNADSDAKETQILINGYTSFGADIKENPTLEDVKKELDAGRPVISMHHGLELANPNHRWRRGGSYYHMMVIVGYDEDAKQFLVNDTGDHYTGLDYRYSYDTILGTLHDYDHKTHKANGPAKVLLTYPKMLVKALGGTRIYLVKNNTTKYYISHPNLFKTYGWRWSQVKSVDKQWLDKLEVGTAISN